MKDPAIWLYDGHCVLCDGAVHYTLAHEIAPSIRFVALQSETGRALAQRHDIDPDNPQSFLFIENDNVMDQSDGVLALIRHLRGPIRLLRLFRWVPRGLRDAAYRLVARNRYRWFGRKAECTLPDPAHRNRFVL